MEIGKFIGIGITAVILISLLKSYKPEIAVAASIITVAVLFFMISPYINAALSAFTDISDKIGIDRQYILVAAKVIGVAYITQIGADICKDAGESAIGTKVELCGKIVIVIMSMPVFYKLLEVIDKIVSLT